MGMGPYDSAAGFRSVVSYEPTDCINLSDGINTEIKSRGWCWRSNDSYDFFLILDVSWRNDNAEGSHVYDNLMHELKLFKLKEFLS